MAIHQANFAELTDLDPILTDIYKDHLALVPDQTGLLFAKRTSTKAKETDLRIGSFGDPVPFDDHGQVHYQEVDKGYTITYTPVNYTNGFQVPQQMLEDMQYDGIFTMASELGRSTQRFRQKTAFSIFENAFSASYLGYDGDPLVSSSHNRSRTDTTAVSNALTLPLNSANLETAIVTAMGLGDDRGEEISIMPNILLTGRALRKTSLELTGSELTPESGNNAINVHNDMQSLIVPYITGNKWFVIDQMMAKQYLKWIDRILPTFSAIDDFDHEARKFKSRMRFDTGWSEFRWVVGSNP
jgi:phage major head subunit gpT-like protein